MFDGIGHFGKVCRRRSVKKGSSTNHQFKSRITQQAINTVNWSDTDECVGGNAKKLNSKDHVILYRISATRNEDKNRNARIWKQKYTIRQMDVNFKLDTGTDVNCIPVDIVNKFGFP